MTIVVLRKSPQKVWLPSCKIPEKVPLLTFGELNEEFEVRCIYGPVSETTFNVKILNEILKLYKRRTRP